MENQIVIAAFRRVGPGGCCWTYHIGTFKSLIFLTTELTGMLPITVTLGTYNNQETLWRDLYQNAINYSGMLPSGIPDTRYQIELTAGRA